MLDLVGSILTGGKILLLDFFLFSCSKASDANVGIIANFVYYGKTRFPSFQTTFLDPSQNRHVSESVKFSFSMNCEFK